MTQAKTIQISSDGVTYYTLPGNTATSAETNQLDDTVYGFDYASTQPGLINWTVSSATRCTGVRRLCCKRSA
jgi:hypothetical protein